MLNLNTSPFFHIFHYINLRLLSVALLPATEMSDEWWVLSVAYLYSTVLAHWWKISWKYLQSLRFLKRNLSFVCITVGASSQMIRL